MGQVVFRDILGELLDVHLVAGLDDHLHHADDHIHDLDTEKDHEVDQKSAHGEVGIVLNVSAPCLVADLRRGLL